MQKLIFSLLICLPFLLNAQDNYFGAQIETITTPTTTIIGAGLNWGNENIFINLTYYSTNCLEVSAQGFIPLDVFYKDKLTVGIIGGFGYGKCFGTRSKHLENCFTEARFFFADDFCTWNMAPTAQYKLSTGLIQLELGAQFAAVPDYKRFELYSRVKYIHKF